MLGRLRALFAGLLFISVACAGGSNSSVQPTQAAWVDASNAFALSVELYAIGSGRTHRLGTVHPGMSARFAIPAAMLGNGPIELQARAGAAGGTYNSDPLLLSTGSVVDFRIAPQLFNSTATIRPD